MKRILGVILTCALTVSLLAGCGDKDAITVISREDGSGTRGVFIELFGIEKKNANGEKIDETVASSDITNSTSVMLTSVAQNKAAIGYISLGSLNDKVKALAIDGVAPTVEKLKTGRIKLPGRSLSRHRAEPRRAGLYWLHPLVRRAGRCKAGYIAVRISILYRRKGVRQNRCGGLLLGGAGDGKAEGSVSSHKPQCDNRNPTKRLHNGDDERHRRHLRYRYGV